MEFNTLAIHAIPNGPLGEVVPAIHLATTYGQPANEEFTDFVYQRGNNPTRNNAEKVVAALEGGRHGFVFGSGMAATAAVLSLLTSGQHVIASASVYGGTYRFLTNELPRRNQHYTFVNDLNTLTDADFRDTTRIVFIETPTNPTLEVADIRAIADKAHAHGALVVVDNTFLTPYLQNPLDLGADIVVHSATKFLGGHGDLLAGVVITNDDGLAEEIAFAQNTLGAGLSPSDCYRLIQGVKTLALRIERQEENTRALIDFLRARPEVAKIYYAGSKSEAEAEIQARQARGIGAVVSIELVEQADVERFLSALEIFTFAVSLGGVESLVCRSYTMTHESFSPEDAAEAGITPRLLRLAIGVEGVEDLKADLDRALRASVSGGGA